MGKRGGRGGKRGGNGGHNNGNRDGRDNNNNNTRDNPYSTDIGTSETFEKYYKAQKIVSEDEWDNFIAVAKSTLPMTFRVTSSRESSQAVNDHVKNEFVPHLSNVVFQGEKQSPPTVLDWYPGGLAWQLDCSKQVVRKSREFAKFQQFLVHETDSGNISRQEAVSMIPPLLLDVHPQHYVLDCCAAPGSKTVQLLEALHARSPISTEPAAPIPEGLLIANDSDAKRCHMLVHQSLNRIGSPNCMITNLDAAAIPTIKIPSDPSSSSSSGAATKTLFFDRILCDVPCSGDGTTRKNPGIWKVWKPADGLGLHTLQLRILSRAIQMLKPGGRLVYSTCSYNPIENEAVVSSALAANPKMSLIDVSDALPGLKRKPGLTSWKVLDRECNEVESVDDQNTDNLKAKPIVGTCWPNGRESELHLERCLRLYPQLQNTGGFFVAVLEKQASPQSSTSQTANNASTASNSVTTGSKRAASPSLETAQEAKKVRTEGEAEDATVASAAVSAIPTPEATPAPEMDEQKMGGGRPFNEDPYSYLPEDDDQVQTCMEFFDLSPDFPASRLFVRNTEGKPLRSVYLSSSSVRSVIEHNDYTRLRLVSCGVKVLVRQDPGKTDTYKCRWRVTQDGLPVLQNFMGPRRKTTGTLKDLRRLCTDLYPTLDVFDDGEFKNAAKTFEAGSLICDFLPGEDAGGKLEQTITLPLWKAPNSICLMVEKMEKKGLSMRIFGEDLSGHGRKGGYKHRGEAEPVEAKAEEQIETADGAAATEEQNMHGENEISNKEEGSAAVEAETVDAEA